MAMRNGHQSPGGDADYVGAEDLNSFKILEGGLEPGDYDAYVGLIDRATLQRLNSPDDFFAEANFPTEEYGDVTLGYYELGMEQLYAECNNRESQLKFLRDTLTYIDECEKEGEPHESPTVPMLVTAQLELLQRRGEWAEGVETLKEQYNRRLEDLVQGIVIDQELKVYRDYTAVRRKWQDAMKNKESVMGAAVGDIVQEMPPFFQIAVSLARRTESGSRRTHIQALLARVTENVTDLMGFRAMQNNMGASTSRGRRKFFGRGRDNDLD